MGAHMHRGAPAQYRDVAAGVLLNGWPDEVSIQWHIFKIVYSSKVSQGLVERVS